ncbi:MAG TPA: Uma2 family endonuclease [Chthoniobacteraceae bacterium]|jgi:Uma2 family endonuclease|nr:Uma2 family endonuclease [Chthoniobacteraceae bacterium]
MLGRASRRGDDLPCLRASKWYGEEVSAEPDFPPYTSLEEYLALEAESSFRHEYVDGIMYAMAGATDEHHTISFNLNTMLGLRLRGHRCRGCNAEMKLKVISPVSGKAIFYYPDAMISCDPTDRGVADGHAFRERPSVIMEILSPTTRRKDEYEKRTAYLSLATLEAYVRFEQERAEAVIDRRVGDIWQVEQVQGVDAAIRLPEIGIELPLAELYEGVVFRA